VGGGGKRKYNWRKGIHSSRPPLTLELKIWMGGGKRVKRGKKRRGKEKKKGRNSPHPKQYAAVGPTAMGFQKGKKSKGGKGKKGERGVIRRRSSFFQWSIFTFFARGGGKKKLGGGPQEKKRGGGGGGSKGQFPTASAPGSFSGSSKGKGGGGKQGTIEGERRRKGRIVNVSAAGPVLFFFSISGGGEGQKNSRRERRGNECGTRWK